MEKIEILHGDSRNVIKTICDNSVDLIILDPPYLTTNEKWDKEEIIDSDFSKELFRVGKNSSSLYAWCGIGEKSQSLIRWFPIFKELWHFKDLITWKKQRGIGMRKGWLYTREELLWFVKDNSQFVWNKENQYSNVKREKSNYGYILSNGKSADSYIKSEYKRFTNVWDDISETSFNTSKNGKINVHFTPKPEKAIERIILAHTKEGDLIFDPFLGSGTTITVCKRLNRRLIGIELDENYYKYCQSLLNIPS